MPNLGLPIAGAVLIAAVIFIVVLFRTMWRVAQPNEALVISGFGAPKDGSIRSVSGKGVLVIPGLQQVGKLSLNLREAKLQSTCVTKQGIKVQVEGVCIYKIGDDQASITNAARRFIGQEKTIDQNIQNLFDGHLRSIIGTLTVEQLISDREALMGALRVAASDEIQKLGLIIDSLQIQNIGDPTGYIDNLSMPHIADVKQKARVAQAAADQTATIAEQEANALKAAASRDSQIKQAGFTAEVKAAEAQAEQQGPLADARAQQQVIVEQTKMQQLEADRTEQELQVSIRKPADANAYSTRVTAEAARDAAIAKAQADAQRVQLDAEAQANAIRVRGIADGDAARAKGLAEADATKAKLMAEAEGLEARAKALAQNQDAVLGQMVAERLPEIVKAAAGAFANIDSLTVLNGAEGMNDMASGVMKMATGMIPVARKMLDGLNRPKNVTDSIPQNGRQTANV